MDHSQYLKNKEYNDKFRKQRIQKILTEAREKAKLRLHSKMLDHKDRLKQVYGNKDKLDPRHKKLLDERLQEYKRREIVALEGEQKRSLEKKESEKKQKQEYDNVLTQITLLKDKAKTVVEPYMFITDLSKTKSKLYTELYLFNSGQVMELLKEIRLLNKNVENYDVDEEDISQKQYQSILKIIEEMILITTKYKEKLSTLQSIDDRKEYIRSVLEIEKRKEAHRNRELVEGELSDDEELFFEIVPPKKQKIIDLNDTIDMRNAREQQRRKDVSNAISLVNESKVLRRRGLLEQEEERRRKLFADIVRTVPLLPAVEDIPVAEDEGYFDEVAEHKDEVAEPVEVAEHKYEVADHHGVEHEEDEEGEGDEEGEDDEFEEEYEDSVQVKFEDAFGNTFEWYDVSPEYFESDDWQNLVNEQSKIIRFHKKEVKEYILDSLYGEDRADVLEGNQYVALYREITINYNAKPVHVNVPIFPKDTTPANNEFVDVWAETRDLIDKRGVKLPIKNAILTKIYTNNEDEIDITSLVEQYYPKPK